MDIVSDMVDVIGVACGSLGADVVVVVVVGNGMDGWEDDVDL